MSIPFGRGTAANDPRTVYKFSLKTRSARVNELRPRIAMGSMTFYCRREGERGEK